MRWRTAHNRRRSKRYMPWLKWKMRQLMLEHLNRMVENFILYGDPKGPQPRRFIMAETLPLIIPTTIKVVHNP
jgi:hypothetical protein